MEAASQSSPSPNSGRGSRRWYACGLVATALLAGWAGFASYFPPPPKLLEAMWPERTAVIQALRANDLGLAAFHLRAWQGLAGRLDVSNWWHARSVPTAAPEQVRALQGALAELNATLTGTDVNALHSAALKVLRSHRACAAAYHVAPQAIAHADGHDGHQHGIHELTTGEPVPSVAIEIIPDPMSGWNVNLRTTNFQFSAEHASTPHVAGEGHAHLFVDGQKLGRLYADWFHLAKLPPGRHTIRVTLNTNDHNDYALDGQVVAAEGAVVVSDPQEMIFFGTNDLPQSAPGSVPQDELCKPGQADR